MLPASRRPRPLPADHLWMFLFLEMDTGGTMEERFFLGEHLIVRRRGSSADVMLGEVLHPAVMAPSVAPGDVVAFALWGIVPIVMSVLRVGVEVPIEVVSPTARSYSVGGFFASKQTGDLQPANIACSNPTCGMLFPMSYSQFVAITEQRSALASRAGTHPIIVLSCEVLRYVAGGRPSIIRRHLQVLDADPFAGCITA